MVSKNIDEKDFLLKMDREGHEATRAVDKRASELNAEYPAKAKQTDQTYCGTTQGTIGPVAL